MNPRYKFTLGLTGNLYTGGEQDPREDTYMGADGIMSSRTGYFTSGRIYVSAPGVSLIVRDMYQPGLSLIVAAFKTSGEPISGKGIGTGVFDFDIPAETAYIRVCTTDTYKDAINIYGGRGCAPVYGSDLAKVFEQESGQQFLRAKLSGKVSLIGHDFDAVDGADFDTEFRLTIYGSTDGGRTYGVFFSGKFMKTDCEFDLDDRRLEVQPDTDDDYGAVLAGMDKEYNLIELAPETVRLNITKRPLIQVYRPGDEIVSCFLSGMYWERDVTQAVSDETQLLNTYYFTCPSRLMSVQVSAQGGAETSLNGMYAGKATEGGTSPSVQYEVLYTGTFTRADGAYRIEYTALRRIATNEYFESVLFKDTDGNTMYSYQGEGEIGTKDVTAQAATGYSGSLLMEMAYDPIFMRYLCDTLTVQGEQTYEIPDEDIVEDNRNYHRVIPYNFDLAYISTQSSDEPTEWGRMDDGRYFMPPYTLSGTTFYPIARSYWVDTSYWFAFSLIDNYVEESARKPYSIRDVYTLSSCIAVLLKQFAPGITHEATEEYSQFLYGARNPISGINRMTLLLTQKTNITRGEYQDPATKTPVTLRQITDMLENCFKCHWYIEDGKFKIEHIQYFLNGGSYSESPAIYLDLTQMKNIRNGKPWAFCTSSYTFAKEDMAERYQFAWMDEVTERFEGQPVEILSKYVEEGKVEEISVSNFTSDIDYMLLNPGAVSEDGFALFMAVQDGSAEYTVPFMPLVVDNSTTYLQNGYLSFTDLQSRYWLYDMPAKHVKVNGMEREAASVSRGRKQTVKCPVPMDVSTTGTVKTYLGVGTIEKLSVNLCSLIAEITLKYDTEQ